MQSTNLNLEFFIKPSKYWLIISVNIAIISIVSCLQINSLCYNLITISLICIFFIFLLKKYYWQTSPVSVLGVRYQSEQWFVKDQSAWKKADLGDFIFINTLVTIICFRITKYKKIYIALFSDSVDQQSLSKLRTMLRIKVN